jgi:hypothetical protein
LLHHLGPPAASVEAGQFHSFLVAFDVAFQEEEEEEVL